MANKTASQAFNRRQTLDEARRLASQNKLPAAIEAFERVVQHDPNDWNSANTLGDLLVRAQLIDRAVAHFVKIAEHRVETGFVAQAIGVYKKILRIAPGNAEALRRSEALQSQRLADTDDGGLSRRIFKAAHAKSGSAPSDEPDHETDTALTPRVGLPPDEVETQADVSPPASASVAPADHGHEYGYIQVEPSEPVSAEPTPAVIEQTHTPVLELEVDVPPAGEAAHADPSIEGRGSASDVERADLFERTTEDDVLDLTAELELSEATPDDAQPWAPAGDAGIAAAEPTAAPEAQSLGRHDRPDGAGGPGGPDAHGWPDADHELASRHEHAEQREHHPGQPEDEEGYDLTAELDVKVIGVDVEDAVSALHASDRAVPETQLEQLEALAVNALQELRALLGGQLGIAQHVGVADDDVERRARTDRRAESLTPRWTRFFPWRGAPA